MTTQTAIFDGLPTGLTLTGKAFDTDTPDTEVTGNTFTITEGTTAKGRYAVAITRASVLPAGDYDIRLFVGSVPISVGRFRFAGVDGETAIEAPEAVELDSAIATKIDNILEDTGTTLPAQISGISGGGGSGDASQETLLLVKAKTDLIGTSAGLTSLLAASVLQTGSITSFPSSLRIGDSYTSAIGRAIQVPIVDTNGVPLSSAGSKNFADATATFQIRRASDTEASRIIVGTAEFIDPPGTGTADAPYALIQLSSSETSKGISKYRYTGLLTFTWPYTGTGTDAEVMSFETGTITFEA